ncbi:hypothetical protein ABZ953_19490 [Streptomyces sp. NPDC046465]|uniref:hypothetical protein n=1 Tax=Streptomyces sp. NPDC046465 TaxID=3155810 RepID=UPI0033C7813C
MRRIARTLTASAALALAPSTAAYAWEGADASASPSTAAPGATVEITVSCPKSDQEFVSADSQAFSGGSVQLDMLDMYGGGGANQHGGQTHYRGSAVPAGASGFHRGGPEAVGGQSSWGIDGTCPDGEQWNTGVWRGGASRAPAPGMRTCRAWTN